ncbi:hypothetical protein [Mesorhizobium sp. LNJC391B00]|uniref:hypothetical protein n=1 Tax=Mesorhizobium sp. LNJC391B00 TaxID=1287273 RepID=UPI0032AEAB3B
MPQPPDQRQRKHDQRYKRDRDRQHADILGQRQQRDEQSGRLEPGSWGIQGRMHSDHRAGDQDGKQQHRDPGGLAVKEKIRQRHEQDGDAEAAGKACKRCHARIFLMGWVRSAGGRIKGSRLASR